MPQYLAPGVYVEEIPGPRTIQGVSTSVAAFIGPCRFGPTSGRPELLTSYLDFVSIYGDAADLNLESGTTPNYLALGAKGFFDEGGSSLYVVRTFAYSDTGDPGGGPCRGRPAGPRRHPVGPADPLGLRPGAAGPVPRRGGSDAGDLHPEGRQQCPGVDDERRQPDPGARVRHRLGHDQRLPARWVGPGRTPRRRHRRVVPGRSRRPDRAHRRVGGLPADGAGRGPAPLG